MTIETLNAIKAQTEALQESTLDLGGALDAAESSGVILPVEVDTAFADLTTNLYTILEWVNQAIEDGTVGEPELTTMQAFLAELKAVFDKYAAVIEYMDGVGYGEAYGGASFYRLTATDPVNGNVETKDIVSAALSSEQLV